jgi:hypothetical protein
MDPVSRRGFLKSGAVAAAATGAVAALPTVAGASAAGRPDGAPVALPFAFDPTEPVVAHVLDPERGEIVLFLGDREVTVTDKSLAARIVRAAR